MEANRLMTEEGYIYVDVRSVPEFDGGHPQGAYNVPLMNMTAAGMEANQDFMETIQATFPVETKIVLGCKAGGRSMKAASMLIAAGYAHVVDQKAGWAGVGDVFGRVTEPGWSSLDLPKDIEAAPGRDHASLRNAANR